MNKRKEPGPERDVNAVPARDIDEYLTSVPEKARAALEDLRQTIRAAAPEAEEVISYKIPTFRYHGSLVAFAAQKNHLSFYVMNPVLLSDFSAEVEDYDASGGTIRFSPDRPLPAELVTRLVKARMEENEKRAGKRS